MDDKTMLELAARAAGLHFQWGREWHDKDQPQVHGRYWNPLTDDGDALRLAVRLRMHVLIGEQVVTAVYDAGHSRTEDVASDRLAATRRAIVRAAAEIGKGMGVG